MKKPPPLILVASALLLLAGVSGRGRRSEPQENSAPDAPRPERVAEAVVELLAVGPGGDDRNRECAATGFLVNERGFILTNAHVVEDARRCLKATPGAKIFAKLAPPPKPAAGASARLSPASAVSCDLVALDEIHDLAILKTERPLAATFLELDPSEIPDGAPVAVTGHPAFAWQPVTRSGRVVRHARLALADAGREASEVLVVDIALERGASGSPVYLETSGGVVGVIERRDPPAGRSAPSLKLRSVDDPSAGVGPLRAAYTVAVPIRYAIELLKGNGVEWHASRRR